MPMFRFREYEERKSNDVYYYREYSLKSNNTVSLSHDRLTLTWKTVPSSIKDSIPSSSSYSFKIARFVHRIKRAVSDLFLPVGYPDSVRGDVYLQYQMYDSIQGLCSYLRGVVSTSAMLKAVGVGDSNINAMSAAVQWAMKDGLGMVGGLIFSYYASPYFDSNIKEFRLFADVINDVGLALDMIAPHVHRSKLLILTGTSTLCRFMCGAAAGATKGSITQHFAIDNMADLNAKEGTQETLVSLVGMIMGIYLARYLQRLEESETVPQKEVSSLNNALTLSWLIFVILTIIHVWANYLGVKILRLNTINRERAEVLLNGCIQPCVKEILKYESREEMQECKNRIEEEITKTAKILGPDETQESIFQSCKKLVYSGNIRLGCRLNESLHGLSHDEIKSIISSDDSYFITLHNSLLYKRTICVTLRVGCSSDDMLKSFIHAIVINSYLKQCEYSINEKDLVMRSKQCVDILFRTNTLSLNKLMKIGWSSKLYLGYDRWRCEWGDDKKLD